MPRGSALLQDQSLLPLFRYEFGEDLDRFSQIVVDLGHDAIDFTEAIDELRNLVHRMKGCSGMAGLDQLKGTMQSIEERLMEIHTYPTLVNPVLLKLLKRFTKDAKEYIDNSNWDDVQIISRWSKIFQG